MDKTTLVESDISDGENLIKGLYEAHINVHTAFWLYDSEADRWRLMIASKDAEFASPKKAYMQINDILEIMESKGVTVGFSLENISVISPNDTLINFLDKEIQTGPEGINGLRISRSRIGNSYIEDAYLYRIQKFLGSDHSAKV
ncbi:MAG: hypothetical protein K6T88_21945 [Bacillus sp. (in: Bacteria)]|nr:hypothetical protein [Bacillus sp. (in: firmicutes)]